MYRIGEFSKITNLTVKALRYYDEQGMLIPSARSESDYRLYDVSDYEKAQLIVLLKEFGFSISEMKDMLTTCESREDISFYLLEKKNFIKDKIRKEKMLIKEIEKNLLQKEKEDYVLNLAHRRNMYEIVIKEIPSMTVASIRFKGKYSDVGKHIGKIYRVVKDKACGAPLNLYYDKEYQEEADIELCVPVKGTMPGSDGVNVRVLPAMRAITTLHLGDYQRLNEAYKVILDYAKENGYELLTPSREVYQKGPGMIFKGNPETYVTEVIVPYQEEK